LLALPEPRVRRHRPASRYRISGVRAFDPGYGHDAFVICADRSRLAL
jgi:hypothetical protein